MKKALLCFVVSVFILTAPDCPAVEKGMELTALNSMQRIGQDDTPAGPRQVQIKAAKNEVESFQVVVAAGKKTIKVVHAQMSDLIGPDDARIAKENIKLFREEYVRVRKSTPRAKLAPGLYPDPLVPFINPITGKPIEPYTRYREKWGEPVIVKGHDMYALPFEVFQGQNQPIWFDVYVPKNIPAGIYKGKFSVTAQGKISAGIPVTLTVWDFTLPDGPTHRNHFGGFGNIPRFFDVERDSQKYEEIELRFCQGLARHRINPPILRRLLPEVNDDGSLKITKKRTRALKKFINQFHITDFGIPRAPFFELTHLTSQPDYKYISPTNRKKTQQYYREYYDYLKENGWEKRAYLYMFDEPNLKGNYEQVLVLGEMVHEAVPELKCFVTEQTYPQNPSWPDIDSAADIWCTLWSFIDRKTINERIAHGDEVWSYTALAQRTSRSHPEYKRFKNFDPPYWHIDQPLTSYRVPTWINRQYNISGLVYWSVYWDIITMTVIEPWTLPAHPHRQHFNGDGYLFYPGGPCGMDDAIDSIRIKNIRDGMEDYEYFVLLENLADKETVKKIVDTVAPEWWNFSEDPATITAARENLALEILKRKKHTDSK